MYEQVEKTTEKKSQPVANAVSPWQNSHAPTSRFVDNRPEAIQMRKLRELAKNSPQNAKLRELHNLAAAHSVTPRKRNGLGPGYHSPSTQTRFTIRKTDEHSLVKPINSGGTSTNEKNEVKTRFNPAGVQAVVQAAPGATAGATAPKKTIKKYNKKRIKRYTKKEHEKLVIEKLKGYIHKKNPHLKRIKKIHTTEVLRSEKVERVGPGTTRKNQTQNFLRHLSTVINSSDSRFGEVQATIQGNTVYIASNSNEKNLPTSEAGIKALFVPGARGDVRVERHKKKLEKELGDAFKGYKYEVVTGLRGQHAETKIVSTLNDNLGFIAGQRRPCAACVVFMRLQGVSPAKFNPHGGAYWETKQALISIVNSFVVPYIEKKIDGIAKEKDLDGAGLKAEIGRAVDMWCEEKKDYMDISKEAFVNKDIPKAKELDYDTASETEMFS